MNITTQLDEMVNAGQLTVMSAAGFKAAASRKHAQLEHDVKSGKITRRSLPAHKAHASRRILTNAKR